MVDPSTPARNELGRMANEAERVRNELDESVGRVANESGRESGEIDREHGEFGREKGELHREAGERGRTAHANAQDRRWQLFMAAMCIFAVIVTVIGWRVIDEQVTQAHQQAQLKKIVNTLNAVVDEQAAQAKANHTSRLADQNRTDAEIRGILTCILAAKQPGDTVACLRGFVRTHPVPSSPARTPSATPTTPSATPGSKPQANSTPTRTVTIHPRPPSKTITTVSPGPTVTLTPPPGVLAPVCALPILGPVVCATVGAVQ